MTCKRWILVVALLGAGAGGVWAQEPGQSRRDRREQLQEAVQQRFLGMVASRLDLTAGERARLAAVLEEGSVARESLMRESVQLRRRLIAAVGDSATAPSEFEDILSRMERLAQREHALRSREQEALAAFLTPRERALFLIMRMRFNEQVREVRGRPPR